MSFFVDANIFLSFLIKRDSWQKEEVRRMFDKAIKGEVFLFTNTIVIFEIFWVLKSFYRKGRSETVSILKKILGLEFIELKERRILLAALKIYEESKLDLEDCYHIAFSKDNSADSIFSFDKKLLKRFEKEKNLY